MSREANIMHEINGFYVYRERAQYTVWRPSKSGTHCTADSAYTKTEDGLSIAVARCDYLARRAAAVSQ